MMCRMNRQYDILLVGAGPLGLEVAVGLKKAGLDYVHVEAGQIGATMGWWATGTRWFSSNDRIAIAGVPLVTPGQEKASREEYLAYLRSVVEQFDLQIQTYRRVVGIERQGDVFHVTVQSALQPEALPETVTARRIILATGGTEKPNLLNSPGEDLGHVSHYFRDPHAYFRKRVLIVGGRNSAVEAALRCHRAGANVTFSYRRDTIDKESIKYWLYPEFIALCKTGKITAHWHTLPTRITPEAVTLQNGDGTTLDVSADFVLLLTGYCADMSLCAMAGVTLEGERQTPTFDPETMQTNVPGVYVAGTAVAGTQHGYKVFLENCHVHVERIVAHLSGQPVHVAETKFDRPET